MSKFNVGDRVRRIKDSYHEMNVGDVDIVIDGDWSDRFNLKKFGCGHTESKFELVKDTKFKVGDKVRAKADCYNDISKCEAIVDKIVSSSEGHILNMVLFITKCSTYYSVGSYTSNSSWQRDIELITDTPKEKLIETDMDTEDIKNFPKAVLVKAEKRANYELANELEEIAVAKFKELFGRIADKERELSRVQSELKNLRGEAKITNK